MQMIIVKLSDGLGNQMFQYALGRHLSLRYDTELRFDLSWFNNRDTFAGTDRSITLDGFDVTLTPAGEDDFRRVVGGPLVMKFFRRYARLFEFAPQYPAEHLNYYREILGPPDEGSVKWAHRRRFCHAMLNTGSDAYIDGYWQTAKYFADISGVIRNDFTVSGTPKGKNADAISEIQSTTAVSVHVRRGDQVQQGPESSKYGNSLPETYHEKAAEHIGQQVTNPSFFVFSDDPEWAREHLELNYPTTYVTHNDGSTDYQDIRLMSHCDHHVMANSTFSWWGAWLSTNPDKIVVAPSPWKRFGYPDGVVEDWDIIPDNWVVLRY